jgi:tetratricopeptide (TPR) repeat protein
MPEKKKMSKPQVPRNPKSPEPAQSTTRESTAAAVARAAHSQEQLAAFESAMKLFHARKLKEAREFFVEAMEGPERDVAQRAQLHFAMCERRLEHVSVALESAEDYYNYGVALINARKLSEARLHLERALELQPGADHICYALALSQALTGDLGGAYENLRQAIELEPRNRIIARQDADFAPVANQPPFSTLLYPEKKNW